MRHTRVVDYGVPPHQVGLAQDGVPALDLHVVGEPLDHVLAGVATARAATSAIEAVARTHGLADAAPSGASGGAIDE